MSERALSFWLVDRSGWIAPADLRRLQAALALSSAECAADWGKPAPTVCIAGADGALPGDGNVVPMVLSTTIDVPQDLAYHTVESGRPYALILADAVLQSFDQVAIAASHELNETLGDPVCDGYARLPSGDEIALENCDPTENDVVAYDLGRGAPVMQSNWVTPAWFKADASAGARLDRLGVCTKPLEVRPGGYAVLVTADGKTKQIGQGPAAFKRHPAFRHGRRLANAYSRALRTRLAA